MKTRVVAFLGVLVVSSFCSVNAVPITTVFSGVVDQGKADFTGTVVDITGLAYEVDIIADSTAPDTDTANPNRGYFMGPPMTTKITIQSLGTVVWYPPDNLVKLDDGVTASISQTWAAGMEGLIQIQAPSGSFGDPNSIVPFAPVDLTSQPNCRVSLGSWGPHNMDPTHLVWFDDFNPTSVSAGVSSVPESGSTLLLAALGVLWCVALRRPQLARVRP